MTGSGQHERHQRYQAESTQMSEKKPFRVLSLDGGGAKGFYTLGVLREIEKLAGRPLCEVFDLIYGTSTGSIIGTLLALRTPVQEIHELYEGNVVKIMEKKSRKAKTDALEEAANQIIGNSTFADLATGIGIVSTNWFLERPMIFKNENSRSFGRKSSFKPGFGVDLKDSVIASCSAFPFFSIKQVKTEEGDVFSLADGGYCANNPALYALADAVGAMQIPESEIRLLTIGVGVYPSPKKSILSPSWYIDKVPSVQLLQKTLEVNTQSMDQLRSVLYRGISTVRINEKFERPEMATDLFEHDLAKLNLLRSQGVVSFEKFETQISNLLES